MKIQATLGTLLLAACGTPPLEWPEVSPNFAVLDAGRRTVYERLSVAREIHEGDRLRADMLAVVEPEHEKALAEFGKGYRYTSRLERVAQLDQSNGVVAFDASRTWLGRPHHSGTYTFVYGLTKVDGSWRVVKAYQLTTSQVVE